MSSPSFSTPTNPSTNPSSNPSSTNPSTPFSTNPSGFSQESHRHSNDQGQCRPEDYQSAMDWARRNCQGVNPPKSEPEGVNWFWVIVILLILGLIGWWWWTNYGRTATNANSKTEAENAKMVAANQALTKQVAATNAQVVSGNRS